MSLYVSSEEISLRNSITMGQKSFSIRTYGYGAHRNSVWTALACGAALISDGFHSASKNLTARILE